MKYNFLYTILILLIIQVFLGTKLSANTSCNLDSIISVRRENQDSIEVINALETLNRYFNKEDLHKALRIVKQELDIDGTALAIKRLHEADSLSLQFIPDSLQADSLLSKLENDRHFQWFKRLQQDSTLFHIIDGEGNWEKIWTRKDSKTSKRFWIHNNQSDSLGFWIHSLPLNGIMITPDFNIVQKKKAENYPMLLIPINFKENPEAFKLLPFKKQPKAIIPWTIGAIISENFSQSYYQHWIKSGQNTITAKSNIHLFANHKIGKWEWENYVKWKYGIIHSEDLSEFVRNEDLLEINTKLGLKASKYWYYSTQLNLKSQLFDGFKYDNGNKERISTLLSPGYLYLSVGMDYKANNNFSLFLSPLTAKLIYVANSHVKETTYGIKEGKHLWKQLGPYVKMKWKTKLIKSVAMENLVELFSNYTKNIQNIDIDWSLSLLMQINYFMSAKISTQLLYDDDIAIPLYKEINGKKTQVGTGKRIQFNENLSIGLVFRL